MWKASTSTLGSRRSARVSRLPASRTCGGGGGEEGLQTTQKGWSGAGAAVQTRGLQVAGVPHLGGYIHDQLRKW